MLAERSIYRKKLIKKILASGPLSEDEKQVCAKHSRKLLIPIDRSTNDMFRANCTLNYLEFTIAHVSDYKNVRDSKCIPERSLSEAGLLEIIVCP